MNQFCLVEGLSEAACMGQRRRSNEAHQIAREAAMNRPTTFTSDLRDFVDVLGAAGLPSDAIDKMTEQFDELTVRVVVTRVNGEEYYLLTDGFTTAVFTERYSGTFVTAQASPTDLTAFAGRFRSAASMVGTATDVATLALAFMDGFEQAEGEAHSTRIWQGLSEAAPVATAMLIDAGPFEAGSWTCAATGAGAIIAGLCGAGTVIVVRGTIGLFNAPMAPPSYCRDGSFDAEQADSMGFDHAPEANGC